MELVLCPQRCVRVATAPAAKLAQSKICFERGDGSSGRILRASSPSPTKYKILLYAHGRSESSWRWTLIDSCVRAAGGGDALGGGTWAFDG